MPQQIDVQGVGIVEFPDETKPEEIQKVLDENFGKKDKPPGMLETVGESALEGVGPGAAFLAAAGPGAEAGALIGAAVPILGETGISEAAGGLIGGMAAGIPAAMLASKAQKAIATSIAPETAGKFYERLESGKKENPWSAAFGDALALGPTARMAPFKLAQLPFRAALGAGLGAAVPAITQQRLPTAPEIVSGVAMSMFAEPRWAEKTGARRPESSPDVREDRKQSLLAAAKKKGLEPEFTDKPLSRPGDVINIDPGSKKMLINEPNLHEYIEQDLPKDISRERALEDLVNHEQVHSVTAPEQGAEFFKNLSPYEQYLEKRRLHGAKPPAKPLTDAQYGMEAIRFWTQLAQNQSATEFISSVKAENRTSKFLTGIQKVVQWTRKNLGSNLSKEALKRNHEILDDVQSKVEAAKQALKKGAPDAVQPEAAQPIRDVLEEPGQVKGEVPAQEPGPKDDEGGGQGQLAEPAQVPLNPNDRLPGVDRDEEGYAGDDQPKVQAALDSMPVGSLVQHRFTEDVYEKKENGEWHHRPDLKIPGNGNADAGKASANGLAKARVLRVGGEKPGEATTAAQVPLSQEEANKLMGGTPDQVQSNIEAAKLKESPPTAPTGEAQPSAPETGKAKPGVAAPVEPATTSISSSFPAVKLQELESLNREVTSPDFKAHTKEGQDKYDRWIKLTDELDKAEGAAGMGPKAQAGSPLAMSRKIAYTDTEGKQQETEARPGEWVATIQKPDGSTYQASYGGKGYDIPASMSEAYGGATKLASIAKMTPSGKWTHGMIGKGEKMIEGEKPPSEVAAMSRKEGELTPEQELSRKLIANVGGVGNSPEKLAMVKDAFQQITALPKEQWPQALTDFHAKWKDQQIADADRELAESQKEFAEKRKEYEDLSSAMEGKLNVEKALQGYALSKMLEAVDRKKIYRSAIGELNNPITPITPPSDAGKPKVLPAGGDPVSAAVRPDYNAPTFRKWWNEFKLDHPHIPEWAAKDIWVDAVNDVLNNASGERIKELLRPARLEKRFLGESLLRTIPDADPNPILSDMAKSPMPTEEYKFKKFCAARDLTPEQGIEALNQLRDQQTDELRQAKAMLEGTTVEPGKGFQREAPGEGEKREQFNEWRKGKALNQKRRAAAINALQEWLVGPVSKPQANPNRRGIGLDDIWFESRGNKQGAYSSYGTKQGEDAGFLRAKLAQGGSIKGQSASKLSRSVVVLVDRATGDYHAVSAYVRQGQPMIYDPSGPVGSKEKGFLNVTQALAKYRVAASMLVKDPLYRLHQKWASETGKSGEQKYNEEIGAVARLKEDASQEQWMDYVNEQEAKRQAEEREQFEQRFEPEEAAPGEEGPQTIKKQSEQRRASEHLATMTDASDPDAISRRNPMSPEDRASIEAWLKGPGGGPLDLFKTDMRSLVNPHLSGNEAEALYEVMDTLKIKSPSHLFALIQHFGSMADAIRNRGLLKANLSGRDVSALYGMHKIANRVYERMLHSPYEQSKLQGLPEIPKDTDYGDMNAPEKEHYVALESLKYRALLKTLNEVYEIAKEAHTTPSGKGAAVEGLDVSPGAKAFGAKALDRYGDTARRDVQSAAVSEGRPPEQSGERSLLAGSKFGGTPRTRAGILAHYPDKNRPGMPPDMLPAGAAKYQEAPPPKGAFPQPGLPTTPSNIGGEGFTGKPPSEIPERGTPVGYGQEKGFSPSGPTRHELLTRKQSANVNPLREPGTEQLVMRKVWRQGEGFKPEEPLAMTRKGYGPSEDRQKEMVAQGRAHKRPDQEPMPTKEQQIASGREAVLSGKINPEKEMRQFERTGYLSPQSTPAFRYWGYRLQSWADAALELNPKSPEANRAMKISDDWQRRIEKSSYKMFAQTGHALQGWNQIGPDDMNSTTFVRRFLKKAKAKEAGVDEEDYEMTDEDNEAADNIARSVKKREATRADLEMGWGEEASKATDPKLDPGQKGLASNFEKFADAKEKNAASGLKKNKPKGAAMAMKGEGGELPPLDPYDEDALGNVGMKVMADLSKANQLTDSAWLEAMKKRLHDPDIERPDLEPYLPHIRAISEEIRDTALNNIVGTGDPMKDARKIFTRKRPPIEQSIEAIHRAMVADPSGNKVSPAEAYHIWNYLKQRFLDKDSPAHTLDFKEIRAKASQELGIKDDTGHIVPGKEYSQLRLFRAMSTNRTMRKMTEDVIKAIRDEARIKGQAMNWLKNQQYPGWLRGIRMFPRLFFFDKIMGHGLVPMITHAPTMMFNPMAWSEYFGAPGKKGAWGEMYRMTFGSKGVKGADYHKLAMDELTGHERFEAWKIAGLQADPFKYTDDYQIEGLQKVFGDKLLWLTAGRGFDALKTLRYSMAEKWLNSLPEHLRNKESMSMIADSVNHATGIVKTNFHESMNWAMFAPKLEASRWAMINDTAKAVDVVRKWKTASDEQRSWATKELMQKGSIVAMYYGMLGLNQAFLAMSGSDQKINFTDPKKGDFMQFKVAGFKVGVASPLIGMVRLAANALHASVRERTKFEKLTPRQKQLMEVAGQYARGKASPLASFGIDAATAQDFAHRPIGFLPWSEPLSRKQRLSGEHPYGVGEYASTTFAPIPLEEMMKNVFKQEGMNEMDASKLLRTLIIGGGMSATGARITEDQK